MKVKTKTAIVVLAAGEASRMGKPKQLLPWGETTLLEHTIKTALEVNTDEILVVLGAHYNEIKSLIDKYPIQIVFNPDWKSGLGTSISKAIYEIQNGRQEIHAVLIMLADQPFISSNDLNLMIKHFRKSENQIIATIYEGGVKGVPVLFDATYFDDLLALNDDYGAKEIIKRYKAFVDFYNNNSNIADLDTPDEYQSAYQNTFNI
ncbi:nucleotidyltransferase family protein [Aestuariibaculum sediminum]|uniref:Nucleotidyltransferase family protein n=1 Tax=Aestuariibaculum sediminum TaxID=2770637 RepID=A0A8J6UHD1_9FLAO|nr:nucleotidyltransferase family protein [Aestuariibaculum sediminum]MBD0832726.1 nucleotidyltransferase family protein [Aestuariibaculum sediminum]